MYSGETLLKDSNKKYKVDSRLGIKVNGHFVDIANVEVGKEVGSTKIKDSHHKVVLEVTTIIRKVISSFYFINPASLTILSFQICRLKGDILFTILAGPSKCTTERPCLRVRVPLKPDDTEGIKALIKSLMLFKELIEDTASVIKYNVINAIDKRSSFGPVLQRGYKDNLPRYTSWLEKK